MKMWIARDEESSGLSLHQDEPIWYEKLGYWWSSDITEINPNLFPEVTFENSPMEVELVLMK